MVLDRLIALYAINKIQSAKGLTLYTTLEPSKVYQERFLPVAAIAQDALSDTDPLYQTISHYLDEKLLAEIVDVLLHK